MLKLEVPTYCKMLKIDIVISTICQPSIIELMTTALITFEDR